MPLGLDFVLKFSTSVHKYEHACVCLSMHGQTHVRAWVHACVCVMQGVYLCARVLSILRTWRAEDGFVQ